MRVEVYEVCTQIVLLRGTYSDAVVYVGFRGSCADKILVKKPPFFPPGLASGIYYS